MGAIRRAATAGLVSVAMVLGLGMIDTVRAADPVPATVPGFEDGYGQAGDTYGATDVRRVTLGLGKSLVVDLPRDASEVLVANPQVANAVVRSTRQAFIIGVATGETNVIFFDNDGLQILTLDVFVGRDVGAIQNSLNALSFTLRGSRIDVKPVGDSVILSGTVTSAADAQTAVDIAAQFVGDPEKVINALSIEGKEQVMLKVTVAEMRRDVVKSLGVNLNTSGWNIGSAIVNLTTGISAGSGAGGSAVFNKGSSTTTATLRALEETGALKTLAEPTLTAISGESASFLAGGQIPVQAGVQCTTANVCTPQIEYKDFGVSLAFTPVVLSEGRISLRVSTAVSAISGTVTVGGVSGPSFQTRRADTTVEIPSGGSLVLAGLIQEQSRHDLSGTPLLRNLPILGALFRSKEYERSETELAIFVTPYIAKAIAPNEVTRPDEGFADASDPSAALLGRFNRIYGIPGASARPAGTVTGSTGGGVGFIID